MKESMYARLRCARAARGRFNDCRLQALASSTSRAAILGREASSSTNNTAILGGLPGAS